MSGGLMQLVAYGAQDIYLTGNPQITYFKTVYRRYTNFSMETIELAFTGEPGFGKRVAVKIGKNGDLATRMYVRVTIQSVDPEGNNFAWIRKLGHAILQQMNVQIGGGVIDRQYGTWLNIWYELARHGCHEIGYARMIGDVEELTSYNSEMKPEYTLYIPLQFWFNRFIGLAVPLIALQYQEMFIDVFFEEAELLAVRDCNFDMNKIVMVDASLLVDYVFLDSTERRRFAQVGHEYLIEQLQWNGVELVNELTKRYRLDFNHPTKEIIWVMKNGNYTTGKTFLYYTHEDRWRVEDAACAVVEKSISIGPNDPSLIVGGVWTPISGTFGTVNNLNITNNTQQTIYVNGDSVKIGNYGITSQIAADVTVNLNGQIDCKNVVTPLTIRDFSIPVELFNDTRFNVCDPIVYQHHNYGILIDGSYNPVHTALLQFNGQDRFDIREGTYFNYVVPEQVHSNTPADGVNVYSFSIFPEEHQPSGTANLSRISLTDLTITFMDSTFVDELPNINFINDDNRLYIYGTNYNILRFLAGLSALAYSIG